MTVGVETAPTASLARRFQPLLTLGYQQAFLAVCESLIEADSEEERELAVVSAIAQADAYASDLGGLGLSASDLVPTLRYAAALRLLRDLLQQGWRVAIDGEGVGLDPPDVWAAAGDDPAAVKGRLRRSFDFARARQLSDPRTTRFILDLERRGVARLLSDGPALMLRLRHAALAADPAQALAKAIQPELELVTPKARDATTGLLLQDIWRYARHYWSIPYQSTPGRNLFYLVRDGAVPERPLIGIAALGNPVIGLSARDDALGWSVDALLARVADEVLTAAEVVAVLVRTLNAAIAEVYAGDLPGDDSDDDSGAVEQLLRVETESAAERRRELRAAGEERTDDYRLIREAHSLVGRERGEEVDWLAITTTPLYRRKRASTLGALRFARAVFKESDLESHPERINVLAASERGRRALDVVLRRIKQEVVASSVMELITCGAIPPYNDLLGGKAVAMLMLSPQVVVDFSTRYAERVSLIASAMHGAPVCRPPELALLTTSSLYAVGTSQYNRIRVSGNLTGGSGDIRYKRLGVSDSFGTLQIASDTAQALTAIARLSDGNARTVNHIFGEGMSPKLRALRDGLAALGLPPETFLRHHSPRLLYAAKLCRNADRFLLRADSSPEYVLSGDAVTATRAIADFWRTRWLAPRIDRPEVAARMAALPVESIALSKDIPSPPASAPTRPTEPPVHRTPPPRAHQGVSISFIERLYRSTNIYADRLTPDELAHIDVDLGLDSYLIGQAEAQQQIIITGNPGDGKTHVIERLRPQLEATGALVLTDANALADAEILNHWVACAETSRPFVLAINEWPLFVLRRLARTRSFGAVAEALRQVQQAVYYVESDRPLPAQGNVVVVDLSLRNILAPAVVRQLIGRLTDPRFYQDLHSADPALANRDALTDPQVEDRLVALLDRVARRAGHVTMRQLVGFVAYCLTGGQTAAERLAAQGSDQSYYATLAFEGGIGALFDAVRETFDPAIITHPHVDIALWRGQTDPAQWRDPAIAQIAPQQLGDADAIYRAVKRRFYFEHENGAELQELLPLDERAFEERLTDAAEADPALVRNVILALNRFYEPGAPDSEKDALHLWQSHRFDVRGPATFVALHELAHQRLSIQRPRHADWVEAWLPPAQTLTRSFAFVAGTGDAGDRALLLVDRPLFLTLIEAQYGLGRASWSRTATRRVTRFIDRLHQAVDEQTGIEDVRVRNIDSDLDQKFEVQRTPPRYLI